MDSPGRALPRTLMIRTLIATASATMVALVSLAAFPMVQASAQVPPSSSSTTTSSTSTSTSTSTTTSTTSTTVAAPPTTAAPVAPGVVLNVSAQLTGTSQITVTWQEPVTVVGSPVTAYKVTVFPTNTTVSTPPSQRSVVFNDLTPGVSYSYYVRAESLGGSGQPSAWTNPITVSSPVATTLPAPLAPQAVVASGVAPNQVQVAWQSPPANGSAPIVQYRITTSPSLGTITTPGNTFSAAFGNALPNVAYSVQVRAVTSTGVVSAPTTSNQVVINGPVVTAPPPPPPPPTGLPLPFQPPTPPGTPRPCVATRWPATAYGKPFNFRTGAPQGVYVWFDGRYWNVKAYNPGPGVVIFTGTIQANTRVSYYASGLDRGDVLSRGRTVARFSFRSDYDIDGIRIAASCATLLSFDFRINGQPVQVYLGSGPASPGTTFTLVR